MDFSGKNYKEICEVLGRANLRGANLRGADLCWANLRGANLRGADLCWADLSGADLYGANLHGADLYGAKLHGADLSGAKLHGANLCWANLQDVTMNWYSHALISERLYQATETQEQKAYALLIARGDCEGKCWEDYAKELPEDFKTWALSIMTTWVKEGDDLPEILKDYVEKSKTT